MEKVILDVAGMRCGACAVGIELMLTKKKGIKSAKVSLSERMAVVEYDPAIVAVSDIAKTVNALPQKTADSANKSCFTRPVLLILSVAAIGFIILFFVHRGLFDLAILMARIDLFAFGGGFESVPITFH